MRNKTLAIFVVLALGVSVALGAVTGVFSSVKIGANTVIPAGTTGYTGTTLNVLSDSPALTGTPTAPTAAPGTNTTQLATTAFVQAAVSGSSHTITDCRSVSCAGGSTYSASTTYTNSSGLLLTEMVSIQGLDPTGGCTGPSGMLTGFVNGTAVLYTEINNDCNTGNISGFTLPVPPGATFSVTVTQVGTGGPGYALYSWFEMN